MSNFFEKTIHPETGMEEEAEWLDDYYGRHLYGVRFSDGKIFRSEHISRTLIEKRLTDMVIANCEADVAEGKYDNWKPVPAPPLGPKKFTDTERLNWLINQSNHGRGWMSDDAWDAYGEMPENQESDDVQTGMRRAIDAAMKEEKNAAKEGSKDA